MSTQQKQPPIRPRPPYPPKGQCAEQLVEQLSVEGEPSYVYFDGPLDEADEPHHVQFGKRFGPPPRFVPPPFRMLKEGRVKPLRMRFDPDPDKWGWEVDEEYEKLRTRLDWALASLATTLIALAILVVCFIGK